MFNKRNKAKKWVKKQLKKDNAKLVPVNCDEVLHEADRKALDGLKKLPLFDKVCSGFIAAFNEPFHNIEDMSSKIRISDKQLPRVYKMTENICAKLGIDMSKLYLELNRQPNACTYGNETATITITSGLLECMEDDELYAVLAHECGHIACKHLLYHTMGTVILDGGVLGIRFLDSGLIGKAITAPLKWAFYNWMRSSELSADRAAAVCCEAGAPVVETMMRLAGGTTHIDEEIKKDLFIQQAVEYKELVDEKALSKAMEFLMHHNDTHPLLAVRAAEIDKWSKTEEFQKIIKTMNG